MQGGGLKKTAWRLRGRPRCVPHRAAPRRPGAGRAVVRGRHPPRRHRCGWRGSSATALWPSFSTQRGGDTAGWGGGGAEDYARQNYLPMARSLPPVSHASSMVIFLRCVMSNPVQVKNVPHYLNPCPTLSKVHSTPRGLYKNGISRSSVRIMFWGKHVFEGCSPWAFPLLFRSITITITMLGFLCAMLNFSAYM